MIRYAILSAILLAVTGCKVAVILVEGGEVQSPESGTCMLVATSPPSGTVCLHAVSDTNYAETFTAVPDGGWEFVRWHSGDDFLCQDSTNPVCALSNVGTAGNSIVENIVDSDKVFYLMPVFAQLNIPNTVIADGKVWKQPVDFVDLTWYDIDAVCPLALDGVCSGTLNGVDMTGLTWAAIDDLVSLFDSYGTDLASMGGLQITYDSPWAPAFFDAGWYPTFEDGAERFIEGWLRNENPGDDSVGRDALLLQDLQGYDVDEDVDVAEVGSFRTKDDSFEQIGAWFYFTP